jgi:hypothetical protein
MVGGPVMVMPAGDPDADADAPSSQIKRSSITQIPPTSMDGERAKEGAGQTTSKMLFALQGRDETEG